VRQVCKTDLNPVIIRPSRHIKLLIETDIPNGFNGIGLCANCRPDVPLPVENVPETLAKQAQEIYRYYLKKYLVRRYARLDLLRLRKHNPLVQQFFKHSLTRFSLVLQLLKTSMVVSG
jgi:hypothetical protein